MKTKSLALALLFFCTLVVNPIMAGATQTILTKEQNSWLDKNKRTISIHPQDSFPPFVFTGSGSEKEPKGFSVDLIKLVAKNLNIKINFTNPDSLSHILTSAKEGDESLILSIDPTDERENYLYFTNVYYTSPSVIVVRKDFSSKKKLITLSDFDKKKVAIGDRYAVASYVSNIYPEVDIVSVPDSQVSFQKLLLGEVDAAVMDLATFSYYTSNDTLSYVKVAGRLGFDYKHAIAIPKSSPELVLILNEGLDSVTEAEMQVLLNKWISIDLNDLSGSNSRALDGTANQNSVVPWLVFVGFVILVSGTIVLVLILQRRQYTFPRFRRRAIPKDVKKEIEDLRIAQEELNHDLAQISELEKDIESKLSDSSRE